MNNKSTRKSPVKLYIAAAVLMVSCAIHAAEPTTNYLAIYLVDGSKTISPPVLSDPDFVSFDTTHYTFVVTATAAKRLARSIWDLEKQHGSGWAFAADPLQGGVEDIIPAPEPFVLEASGQPIYSGFFYTILSSSGFSGPVILPDVEFIKTNSTDNVSFRIELGYPGTFPGTPDPRGDFRIQTAVDQLSAHEKK